MRTIICSRHSTHQFDPMKHLFTLAIVLFCFPIWAQVNYTANDVVPPYEGNAFFGSNMGYYEGWRDEQLADIAAGNPNVNLEINGVETVIDVEGIGVKALRPTLPEWFLEEWGYNIRVDAFQHYGELGLTDNTCFLQTPTEAHRDTTFYCPTAQSTMFRNLYLDIWDDGSDGTPVNDSNFYALYVYKTVSKYKDNIKFWEIWNEPDFSFSANSVRLPGEEGSWWDNNPDPCEYKLHAPIFDYIRMLRISYEVIKSIDPDALVAVGGLGYPSFLDAILRNTDNPDNGQVTAAYPLGGGAYFDVLSYHSYPHIDNSMREWSNEISDFVYFRHSDRAVDGLIELKKEFEDVLLKYNYDGTIYPEKRWIITETNLPRLKYGEFIGSDESQRNFLIKALVTCMQEGIDQFHVFNLSDISSLGHDNEFNFMGLYKTIANIELYTQRPNDGGIAYHTTSKLLHGSRYDAEQTELLNLPDGARGMAFKQPTTNEYTYVLWAETHQDESEEASVTYTFPSEMNVARSEIKHWDHTRSGIISRENSNKIELTGSPVFVNTLDIDNVPVIPEEISISVNPNPIEDTLNIEYGLKGKSTVRIDVYDVQGKLMTSFDSRTFLKEDPNSSASLEAGTYQISFDSSLYPKGVYFCQLSTVNKVLSVKVMKY